jgi:hypothetical protein
MCLFARVETVSAAASGAGHCGAHFNLESDVQRRTKIHRAAVAWVRRVLVDRMLERDEPNRKADSSTGLRPHAVATQADVLDAFLSKKTSTMVLG